MDSKTKAPLTIYKASAGSGKTFTLTVEYISLLIANPDSFRHILAVTFTNKATEEMKMRILAQLYGISRGLKSSEGYLMAVSRNTGLPTNTIRTEAARALHSLLHNYSYFRVETIDSFFQRIFRNLAHELDLTPNLRIDLNDVKAMNEAVDKVVSESAANQQTRRQLMKFIEESIADDNGWNVIDRIKAFGKNIFKDFYKENSEAINESTQSLAEFEKMLRQTMKDFETKMDQLVEDYYSTNPKPNRNIDGYFNKLRRREYTTDALVNKTVEKNPDNVFDATEDFRLEHIKEYMTAKAALPNLNQLALLHSIEQKLHELNNDANRFLLNDTQSILYKMIHSGAHHTHDNAPFSYDKIGARLQHIMIDEFQDTSVVQWKNFQVLLNDCISQEQNTSLVVGDVKQSIYRWRSGDWRLLNDLESSYEKSMVETVTLKTNYRSEQNIVEFNNRVFEHIVRVAQEELVADKCSNSELIAQAYSDIKQEPKNHDGKGYVRIDFLGADDYENQQLEHVYNIIVELKEKGYKERDIAILLRSNKDIALIANYFAQYHNDIEIVSDEAFKLSASTAVSIIVEAMRYIAQGDDISLAHLVVLYQTSISGRVTDETRLFLDRKTTMSFLPDAFATQIEELRSMPIYELAEQLFCIFGLEKLQGESCYLCTFFDCILDFVNGNATSLRLFLKEWDNTLSSKNIQSDGVNGIRALTIHKSKGLEYKNVIIPFCDWKLELGETLWVNTSENSFFQGIPVLPVNFSKALKDTFFASAYNEEHLQNMVDNINMLYVAFTRAERNLFVLTKSNNEKGRISTFLTTAMENFVKPLPETFEYGKFDEAGKKAEKNNDDAANVFSQKGAEVKEIEVCSTNHRMEFRESNKSNIFLSEGDDTENVNRERGVMLHNIFSEIQTSADVKRVMDSHEENDEFNTSILTRQEAEEYVRRCLENVQMSDWFSGEWQVCNERELLSAGKEGKTDKHRCDRIVYKDGETVVIDFKFGKPEKKYYYQVRNYMTLLSQVGFKNVKGYLWYAEEEKLEEVK